MSPPLPHHIDDGPVTSAAVALPLLGLFLLMPPLIILFAHGAGVGGVPLIVLYVFGVWCALIICAVGLARRLQEPASQGPAEPTVLPPHPGS